MKPIEYIKSLPEYSRWRNAIGDYNSEKDYSGAEKSWSKNLIPSTLYGINCNTSFYIHDAYYELGGKKKDRWDADCAMLIHCLWCIDNHPNRWYLYGSNWLRKHMARNRAIKYFEAVRTKGHGCFNFITIM